MEVSLSTKTIIYPEISRYTSYRDFLRDFFEYKKSLRSGFSYRQFSGLVGLKSPNYLQLVIQGKRNMTEETGQKVAKALKLSKEEGLHLEALIRLDNATSGEEKIKAQKNIHASLKKMLSRYVEKDAQDILGKWYHLLVREMVNLKDFEASGEYISERLQGIITAEEAEKSFTFLLKAGYLELKKGKYIQADPILDTGIDIFNHSFMQDYHGQTLKAWSQNIEKLGYEHQELGVLNIPINKTKLPELQEKIRQFQDEIIGWCQGHTDCDDLVQLGTYLMHFKK
ncbi:hypothetical protein AZI86_16700 [Bdellovibrio bacteriovorus]|uniref:DUF4423 domain-containing protein n=1 Tax=Bdellovibrio bacteriovorus TaxID=959 RepID=A0A150WH98_BDEBC|nr:TIGR02147 family protein [Bdellovibrio bacteriovorus]KYG62471.1 hypothetical protein AZI86_16700 [Bdellovibrio bacteriovorus]